MTQQYIAEVRIFGFNFAPIDWAQCNGQPMDISQNSALYAIIGTTYGGNGQTTFNLPNLQDRTAAGMGQGSGLMNWPLGGVFGEANHTLLIGEVPQHRHQATGAEVVFGLETAVPGSTSYPGRSRTGHPYSPAANSTLAPATIALAGGSLPHPNVQPVLVMNYCICLFGVFPPQS
jgi:microcystin-dependent protein